jgi:hypothetical protein
MEYNLLVKNQDHLTMVLNCFDYHTNMTLLPNVNEHLVCVFLIWYIRFFSYFTYVGVDVGVKVGSGVGVQVGSVVIDGAGVEVGYGVEVGIGVVVTPPIGVGVGVGVDGIIAPPFS